ncbi:helix-turn-helix domain-containing protein [Phenylobacterium kunshanense]|uniref:AraC family transcriptional regulator n=1 Tax=Phenylobacterium kunshanense TaxID=1445034 RepID=A0A328B5J1_9CAUL|nr:helix-turn-helix domain-containing protein [Phenylobacterium kunshanense]RAK62139.1 AraC family transcriptional regulator [Phenylobacterium kunshanense]
MNDVGAPPSPSVDPLERARLRMTGDLGRALSLADCAAAAGLSPYHFSRQFAARYGTSPIAYARSLRLHAAAERLASQTPPRLIDLALDCGFDTQEGFTRAFARAFGVTPGRFQRGARPVPSESPPMPSGLDALPTLIQADGPERMPALRIAGLSQIFEEATKAGIPALWGRLFAHPALAGWTGGQTFGVCAAIGEGSGDMRYMAGLEAAGGEPAPPGLEFIELPSRDYLIFTLETQGPDLHAQMQAAAREIWGQRLPRTGLRLARAPDLEVYPPGFDPSRAGATIAWWIPVEP